MQAGARDAGRLESDSAHLQLTISPPDKRHRDTDNVIASLKSALDGIADATGIDDSRWQWQAPVVTTPCKSGRIVVTLAPL
jgi:crossover junction endodeoxyribonuclease RusA